MGFYVQYHNYDHEQPLPLENLGGDGDDLLPFYTTKASVRSAKGKIVYLIAGMGKGPRRYLLWRRVRMTEYEDLKNGYYQAWGVGKNLCPPIDLGRKDPEGFREFKRFMGNFGRGFSNIEPSGYHETLESLFWERSVQSDWDDFEDAIRQSGKYEENVINDELDRAKEECSERAPSERQTDPQNGSDIDLEGLDSYDPKDSNDARKRIEGSVVCRRGQKNSGNVCSPYMRKGARSVAAMSFTYWKPPISNRTEVTRRTT